MWLCLASHPPHYRTPVKDTLKATLAQEESPPATCGPLTVLAVGTCGEARQPGGQLVLVSAPGVHSVGVVKCCLLSRAQAPARGFPPWGP